MSKKETVLVIRSFYWWYMFNRVSFVLHKWHFISLLYCSGRIKRLLHRSLKLSRNHILMAKIILNVDTIGENGRKLADKRSNGYKEHKLELTLAYVTSFGHFSVASGLIKEKNNRIFLILAYQVYFATFSPSFFILFSFPHLTHI